MEKFIKNKFTLIIGLIILFFIGFMAGSTQSSVASLPNNIFGSVFAPISGAFTRLWESGGNLVKSITQYNELKAENEKLRLENLEKDQHLSEYEKFKKENEQLKQLLKISEVNPDFEYVAADIIGTEAGQWDDIITINKGTMHNVKKNDPVITPEGLVGFVCEVGYNFAKVQKITHMDSSVSAFVIRTGLYAVTSGDYALAKKNLLKLDYLDMTVLLNRGDMIVTSGVGGKYPEGIRIGRVSEMVIENTGVSQYAVISPAVDFDNLTNVFIITDFEAEDISK